MKTLENQINEIKNQKSSRINKYQALIKLGLRDHEIGILFDMWASDTQKARRFSFTFGVEIECNITQQLVETHFTQNGVNYQYEGYNHRDNKTYYKFVRDASVRGDSPIECVSPVLTGTNKGFDSLKACCDSLNEGNAQVNRSCGLHVHIGGNISEKQFANVFQNYAMLENVIDTFMAQSRRANNNIYCHSMAGLNFENCSTVSDVQSVCSHDRYFKVNPMAWNRHHTIEFRQHQGTTSYEKISNWVKFCAQLVAWSKDHRFESPITSIDEIEFLTKEQKEYFSNRVEQLA